jgi:hypothetical protein
MPIKQARERIREHETSIALVTISGLCLPCARPVKRGKGPEQSNRAPQHSLGSVGAGVEQISEEVARTG